MRETHNPDDRVLSSPFQQVEASAVLYQRLEQTDRVGQRGVAADRKGLPGSRVINDLGLGEQTMARIGEDGVDGVGGHAEKL